MMAQAPSLDHAKQLLADHETIRVLIADSSEIYGELSRVILGPPSFKSELVTSVDAALTALSKTQYDMVLIDTDLDGGGFELLDEVSRRYPDQRVIMTTERNTDEYLDIAVSRQIGNFLCKPLKRDELTGLVARLVTGQGVFGLANYLGKPVEHRKLQLRRSQDIPPAINLVLNEAENWGFSLPSRDDLRLVLQEMMVNAMYHGYGFTEEKMKRQQVELPGDHHVAIEFGHDGSRFGIGINDFSGKLGKADILASLYDLVNRNRQIQEMLESGQDPSELILDRGRGLDLCRRLSGEYYFNLKRGERTEIIIIHDTFFYKDDDLGSIKIIEL